LDIWQAGGLAGVWAGGRVGCGLWAVGCGLWAGGLAGVWAGGRVGCGLWAVGWWAGGLVYVQKKARTIKPGPCAWIKFKCY